MLIDTHCHIHFDDYKLDPDEVIADSIKSGVTKMICVGCTSEDSKKGVDFVQNRENCFASIGIHPHESKKYDINSLEEFSKLVTEPKVVAIGEAGLDYYYNHSDKDSQIKVLEYQLDLAQKHNLPVIFHVREAFDDFWSVLSNFKGIKGVIHSFTADTKVLDKVLSEGLYVGLNGIITFTKEQYQLDMAKKVPLQNLLLETDAPFLTPSPFRGTICQPKHVLITAEFLADLRGESLGSITARTTYNAEHLFKI
jgi:TatD DNase family protein